jgi:hypothetical protein
MRANLDKALADPLRELASVKIGGARRIPMAALVAYVASLIDRAA